LEAFPEVVPCVTNWPSFPWDVPHKGINANTGNGVEKILQSPGEPRAGKLYRGFCVNFQKLNAELRLWRSGLFDEKVDSIEFESVSQWLWAPEYFGRPAFMKMSEPGSVWATGAPP
jgi:hypothetical protein